MSHIIDEIIFYFRESFLFNDHINCKNEENKKEAESKNEPTGPVYNTDPDERMCGFLVKSSAKVPGSGQEGGDLLGMVVNGIGSGLKLGLKTFTETIQIKQVKSYFALKNGLLYWYAHERSREA